MTHIRVITEKVTPFIYHIGLIIEHYFVNEPVIITGYTMKTPADLSEKKR